jgi:2-polyprenyl-6-hydroxyphenyl methylase/3-demethylubiquinone-9 3-methyltransferase
MPQFRFGDNWSEFIDEYFTEDRVAESRESLTEFYGISDFDGKSFLDIGSGSGIFSYAAYQLGADEIVSFDIDPEVVETTKKVRGYADNPNHWEVKQGNILDEDFVTSLSEFDLIYSWGVLHHTGGMFDAIENSLEIVAPNGLYYLAVANDGAKAGLSSETWEKIKRIYNKSPDIGKRLLELWYICGFIANYAVNGENPIRKMRNYQVRRGMAFYPDVKDWLGATPFEFAPPDEVINLVTDVRAFALKKLRTAEERENTSGTGCNEYLFERTA